MTEQLKDAETKDKIVAAAKEQGIATEGVSLQKLMTSLIDSGQASVLAELGVSTISAIVNQAGEIIKNMTTDFSDLSKAEEGLWLAVLHERDKKFGNYSKSETKSSVLTFSVKDGFQKEIIRAGITVTAHYGASYTGGALARPGKYIPQVTIALTDRYQFADTGLTLGVKMWPPVNKGGDYVVPEFAFQISATGEQRVLSKPVNTFTKSWIATVHAERGLDVRQA